MASGYLLNFLEFCKALRWSYQDPSSYAGLLRLLQMNHWLVKRADLSEIELEIDGQRVPLERAYALFSENENFHYEFYQRAMDVWR